MRYLWFLLLFSSFCFARGQTSPDSAIAIPMATVEADRYALLPIGSRSDSLNIGNYPSQVADGLDDVLEDQGLMYVRKYGPVGLATISMRGTSVSQSAVLWNGMNLQSPMNGQKDLRLIPSFFLESASVSFGAGSAIAGSGAIGGTLELETQPSSLDGWRLGLQNAVGSYGSATGGLSVAYGRAHFKNATKFYLHTSDNDYTFYNTTLAGAPVDTLRHARVRQYGFQQHNSFATAVGKFEVNLMHLRSDRQLPTAIFEQQSRKAQQDATTYANVGWKIHNAKSGWNVELGWIDENINYQDSALSVYAVNKAHSFVFQPEYSHSISGRHLVKVSGYHRSDVAKLDVVEDQVTRHESALIGSMAFVFTDQWMLNANLRGGFSRGQFQPVIPSVATSFAINEMMTAKLQLSRHYREPTLNDLYWEPGGNPDLEPEQGSALDATCKWNTKVQNGRVSFVLTGFATYIRDQIVWEPEGLFWSPHNVSEVFTRGAEGWFNVNYPAGALKFRLRSGASFTRATQDEFLNRPQLPQIPRWKSTNQISVRWKGIALRYLHQWTGKRFTNASNTSFLPGYDVGTLEVDARHETGDFIIEGFVRIENIWNRNYRVVAAHFMPPRYFKAGLSILFQDNKN